jgi:hypothetical protein
MAQSSCLLESAVRMLKPTGFLIIGLVLLTAMPAAAQQAEKMTCEQAKSFFARNGYINKVVHGKTMPIRRGVPINQTISCGSMDNNRFTTSVQTVDKKRCNVAHYCG